MDYEERGELDDVSLLTDFASPLTEIALELINPLFLQVYLQTFPETGPVGVLR